MFAVNYQKRKKKALKVAVWGTDSVATLQLIKKKKKKKTCYPCYLAKICLVKKPFVSNT